MLPATPGITSYYFARHKYGRELAIDACRMEDWSGLGDGAQRNDFHEVLVVLGGRGVVRQDEAEARLRPPCILFTAPGQVRRLKLTKALRGPVILWAQDAVDRIAARPASRLAAASPLIRLSTTDMARATRVAESMVTEIESPRSDLPRMLETLLAQFLLLLDRRMDAAKAPSPHSSLQERLHQLVEARFRFNHRVSFYARTLGVSADHLAAVVRRQEGSAVRSLIQQRILLEAKRLLLHSDLDVAEIAYSLGYEDPSHFTRAFRRDAACSPKQFRARSSEMYQ